MFIGRTHLTLQNIMVMGLGKHSSVSVKLKNGHPPSISILLYAVSAIGSCAQQGAFFLGSRKSGDGFVESQGVYSCANKS
jgi:hypothetical protein